MGRGSRRGRSKATIGSTSYDGTENEPFEPGWSGATWYGAASGTYWTINPKEYADPRKHGPEYLARARRSPKMTAAGGDPQEAAERTAESRAAPEAARRERARSGSTPADDVPADSKSAADVAADATGPLRLGRTSPLGEARPRRALRPGRPCPSPGRLGR